MQRFCPQEKSRNPQDLRRGKDLSLKTASVLHILAEGGDIVDGRILDFVLK